MICFLTGEGKAACVGALLSDPSAPRTIVLPYSRALVQPVLPKATYVFTDFDTLNTLDLTDAARLFRRLKEEGCRVLNDPARVSTRFALLRQLHESGLNPINAYLAAEGSKQWRFPVFIRMADGHDGPLSDLIWDQPELDLAIEAAVVAGFPRSTILIVEYAAQTIRSGVFRKSSVYRIGDHFVSDIWWYGTSWAVKGDRDGLADQELYDEELKMMHDNSYVGAVEAAFALANIEYGRLDFGLVDGSACVYEINTNPTLFGPRSHPIPERVESLKLRWARLIAAFHAIDTESKGSRELIAVAGSSIEALTEANRVFPSLRFNHLRLSQEHDRRGDLSAALDSANAALAANPTTIQTLSQVSRILTKHNRLEDAIAISERAIELDPRATGERHQLVQLLMKVGRLNDARDRLQKAVESDSDTWMTYFLLSRVYAKLGDHIAALNALRRSAQLALNEGSVGEWLRRLARKVILRANSALRKWREPSARSVHEGAREELGTERDKIEGLLLHKPSVADQIHG